MEITSSNNNVKITPKTQSSYSNIRRLVSKNTGGSGQASGSTGSIAGTNLQGGISQQVKNNGNNYISTTKTTNGSDFSSKSSGTYKTSSGETYTVKTISPEERKYPTPIKLTASQGGNDIVSSGGIMISSGGKIIGTYTEPKKDISTNIKSSNMVNVINQKLNTQKQFEIIQNPVNKQPVNNYNLGVNNLVISGIVSRAQQDIAMQQNDFSRASSILSKVPIEQKVIIGNKDNTAMIYSFPTNRLKSSFSDTDIRKSGSNIAPLLTYGGIRKESIKQLEVAYSKNSMGGREAGQVGINALYQNIGLSTIKSGQYINKYSSIGNYVIGFGEQYLFNPIQSQKSDLYAVGTGAVLGWGSGKIVTGIAGSSVLSPISAIRSARFVEYGGTAVFGLIGASEVYTTYKGAGGGVQGQKAVGTLLPSFVLGGASFSKAYGNVVPKPSVDFNFNKLSSKTSPSIVTETGFSSKSYTDIPIKVSEYGRSYEGIALLVGETKGTFLPKERVVFNIPKPTKNALTDGNYVFEGKLVSYNPKQGNLDTFAKFDVTNNLFMPNVGGSKFFKGQVIKGDVFSGIGKYSGIGDSFIGIVSSEKTGRVLSIESFKTVEGKGSYNILELQKTKSKSLGVVSESFGNFDVDSFTSFKVSRVSDIPFLNQESISSYDVSFINRRVGGTYTKFNKQISLGKEYGIIENTYNPIIRRNIFDRRGQVDTNLFGSGFDTVFKPNDIGNTGTGGSGFDTVFKPENILKSDIVSKRNVISSNRDFVSPNIGGFGVVKPIISSTGMFGFGFSPKINNRVGGINSYKGVSSSIVSSVPNTFADYTNIVDVDIISGSSSIVNVDVGSSSVSRSNYDVFSDYSTFDVINNIPLNVPKPPFTDLPIVPFGSPSGGGGGGSLEMPRGFIKGSKKYKLFSKASFGTGQSFNLLISKGFKIKGKYRSVVKQKVFF